MARHTLQRLPSPSPSISLGIHSSGVALFSYCFYFMSIWEASPISKAWGGHYQFFTVLSLAATLLCFALGSLADITSSSTLFQLKNLASMIAVPSEVIVTLMYWGLSALDRELIKPADVELPTWLDLSIHLAPAVFLALDFLLLSPPWAISTSMILALSTCLCLMYWVWVEICFSHNGWYPYPFFGMFTTFQRALFFSFCGLLSTASATALKGVYACVNGSEVSRKQKKSQ